MQSLAKWNFCSDHLPLSARVELNGGVSFNLTTWNVLNTLWIDFISNQGLEASLIVELNIKVNGEAFTLREKEVIATIKKLAEQNDIICLQEVSKKVIQGFDETFDQMDWGIWNSSYRYHDLGVILFSKKKFSCYAMHYEKGLYSENPDHYLISLKLRENSSRQTITVINTHVPAGKDAKGPAELAERLNHLIAPEDQALVCGDMNKSKKFYRRIFSTYCPKLDLFVLGGGQKTHINTEKKAVSYDHIWATKFLILKPLSNQASATGFL